MVEASRSEDGRGTRRVLGAVGVIGIGMVMLAATFAGARAALGVAVGAAIALANLWVFDLVVRRLLAPSSSRPLWAVVAGVKFCALVCGTFLVLDRGLLPLLPLAIGYGALPLGIVASATRTQTAIGEN